MARIIAYQFLSRARACRVLHKNMQGRLKEGGAALKLGAASGF